MSVKTILFVLTSHTQLGESDKKTGFHFEEMSTPFYVLEDNAIRVEIASVAGGRAVPDPGSVDTDNDENNPETVRRFRGDEAAMRKLENTLPLDTVEPDVYDGIYLPGGHGTMWDFPENQHLARIIEKHYQDGKIIGGICHGPAGFVSARTPDGEPIVKGRHINCFTDAEEKEVGLDDTVPFLLESKLRDLGAIIEKADPFQTKVVRDRLLVTGQNPASADGVGLEMIRALGERE